MSMRQCSAVYAVTGIVFNTMGNDEYCFTTAVLRVSMLTPVAPFTNMV